VAHEFQYVVGVLYYVQSRLSAPATIQAAQKSRRLQGYDDSCVGAFLNLSCGHNNSYSKEEKRSLEFLLGRAASSHGEVV
jgi:hypothetical protein